MNNFLPCALFPCNMISEVLGKVVVKSELPVDIDESIRFAYSLLSRPHAEEVLTLYFKEGLSQTEISKRLPCSHTLVYITLVESMKELSLGNRAMLFTHGYAYCIENRIVGPWLLSLEQDVDPDWIFNLPVFELGFNGRILNSLSRLQIKTVRDLTQRTEDELVMLRNMGVRGITTIKARLAELGLSLVTKNRTTKNNRFGLLSPFGINC